MKIALLYICTGCYNQFFKGFYESCEKYFVEEAEKEYFVWSDDKHISDGLHNVHLYYKKCAGFPADSLFRFEMFMQAEEALKQFDYIYFLNANAAVIKPVGTEILPDSSGLAMGIWPDANLNRHPMFFPYERNKKSLAYVKPWGKDYHYFMGGFNGGTPNAYLSMIRTLCHNIRTDYENGIIAKVHDESHINRYLRDHKCKIIGPRYTTPEEFTYRTLDYEPKIIFRDKVKIDSYFNKGRKQSRISRYQKAFKKIINAIKWYFPI